MSIGPLGPPQGVVIPPFAPFGIFIDPRNVRYGFVYINFDPHDGHAYTDVGLLTCENFDSILGDVPIFDGEIVAFDEQIGSILDFSGELGGDVSFNEPLVAYLDFAGRLIN
jgi:hypothetical protein